MNSTVVYKGEISSLICGGRASRGQKVTRCTGAYCPSIKVVGSGQWAELGAYDWQPRLVISLSSRQRQVRRHQLGLKPHYNSSTSESDAVDDTT